MHVLRSALVARPAVHVFDLIEGAEHYPSFLPWCAGATIVARDDAIVSADLQVRWGPARFAMRTRNSKARPERMTILLERGPFRRFQGEWLLHALREDACRVEFELDYAFDGALLGAVAGPVFDRIADTLVDAFVRRAYEVPVAGGTTADGAKADGADATGTPGLT